MSEHRKEHHAVGAASGLTASAGGYALKIAWIPSEGDLKGRLAFGSWTGTGTLWVTSTSSTNGAWT
jgi:hypothetical protein